MLLFPKYKLPKHQDISIITPPTCNYRNKTAAFHFLLQEKERQ